MARMSGNGWKIGDVRIWTGLLSAIPVGWQLCDGTNGTPNMVNNAVVGAGGKYSHGQEFGSEYNKTGINVNSMTLSQSQMPSHSHVRDFNYASGNGGTKPVGFANVSTAFTKNTRPTGGSNSHGHTASMNNMSVMQPSVAVYWIMRLF